MKAASPFWSTCRWCGSYTCRLARWTLWLLLSALLALQLYVLAVHQFPVPAFILRAIESRLAVSQLTVRFRHAAFDPSGALLAEDVRLESTVYAEPLFTASGLYVRFDPWALLAGHFDPREIRAAQASLYVPAMLSPTGQTEALVSDCDCTADFAPNQRAIKLVQFNGHIANLVVTARGGFYLPVTANPAATGMLPLAGFLAKKYPDFSRQLASFDDALASFDEPQLQVELTPSNTRGAFVTAVLNARAFHRETPWPMHATGLRATVKMPLPGPAATPASLELSATDFSLPARANAQAVRLQVQGVFPPGRLRFDPRTIDFSAATFGGWSLEGDGLLAHVTPGPLPRVQAEIAGTIAGDPVSLRGTADLTAQNARLGFAVALGPALLARICARTHSPLPGMLALTKPIALRGDAEFADGWRLAGLSTHFEAEHFTVQNVPVDAVRGRADLHGHDLRVTDIVLHQHDNFALGNYSMDIATLDFRFLLHGRLRPLEIASWFDPAWAVFWKDFNFTSVPPEGDADVQGRWGVARTDVFVFADAASPVVRGVPFDRVRVILHMLPDFYDGREVLLVRGARTARGHFTRSLDPAGDIWHHMEFDVTSNLDLTESARLFGKSGAEFIAPFKFAQPPTLHASGTLDSPDAPGGEHQLVQLVVASAGAFKLYDFPLNDVSFDATLRDNDIDLPRIEASFAEGTLKGRAFLTGPDETRRLRFDFHLTNTSLGRTITTVDDFLAEQKNEPPDPPTKFIQRAADIRFDLAAVAEGGYHDPLSFAGRSTVSVTGAELTQIHLLGFLSPLFPFTSLRFTDAKADFTIAQNKLSFPTVTVTGANSEIKAKGDYWLDKKTLDFNAKVYPFGESKFVLLQVADKASALFSALAEVKLTGTLDKPKWAFAYGPTSFFRKLTQSKSSPSVEKSPPAEPEEEKFSPYLNP